eukprot:2469886-Rhodomonas_salina.1
MSEAQVRPTRVHAVRGSDGAHQQPRECALHSLHSAQLKSVVCGGRLRRRRRACRRGCSSSAVLAGKPDPTTASPPASPAPQVRATSAVSSKHAAFLRVALLRSRVVFACVVLWSRIVSQCVELQSRIVSQCVELQSRIVSQRVELQSRIVSQRVELQSRMVSQCVVLWSRIVGLRGHASARCAGLRKERKEVRERAPWAGTAGRVGGAAACEVCAPGTFAPGSGNTARSRLRAFACLFPLARSRCVRALGCLLACSRVFFGMSRSHAC